jgi:hypothetical protein
MLKSVKHKHKYIIIVVVIIINVVMNNNINNYIIRCTNDSCNNLFRVSLQILLIPFGTSSVFSLILLTVPVRLFGDDVVL